ncbi:MAG: restriction endonuclease subunit S [Bacteroidetes bacterium]|nr:MAG: restriction endonuclease subunit S [Bacteroidota bacterium]
MGSNYKRIGDFIRPIKVKNRELKYSELLGINIDKFFMPSVANVVGTDMTNYKVVKPGQFACNRMHVGRDYRIPVALSRTNDPFIVSPAYDVFEITKPGELDADFLMMWFSRKEYDRNAWFHTDADVRGGLSWDAFCSIGIPIPPIEKQREIVAEYQAVQKRIQINEQLIQKLEETAQAVYRRWFVEFEFPDENGMPYKSSGGEMVETIHGEIPIEWEIGTLFDLIELQRGFDLPTQNRKEGTYPIFASTGTNEKHSEYKVKAPGIVTGRSGSLGEVFYVDEDFWPLNTTLWVKHFKRATPIYSYYVLKGINIIDYNGGSAVPTLNRNDIHRHQLIIPEKNKIEKFEKTQKVFFKRIKLIGIENQKLSELKNLLLSKLATIKN